MRNIISFVNEQLRWEQESPHRHDCHDPPHTAGIGFLDDRSPPRRLLAVSRSDLWEATPAQVGFPGDAIWRRRLPWVVGSASRNNSRGKDCQRRYLRGDDCHSEQEIHTQAALNAAKGEFEALAFTYLLKGCFENHGTWYTGLTPSMRLCPSANDPGKCVIDSLLLASIIALKTRTRMQGVGISGRCVQPSEDFMAEHGQTEAQMEKAILIPANPHLEYVGGGNEGSIIAHAVRIEDKGADIWRLVVPGNRQARDFPHDDIRTGYLYDVHEKRVTHVCEIKWIKPLLGVSFREVRKYVAEKFKTRRQFEQRGKSFYAIKIVNILALKRIHCPKEFSKYADGKPVERVMNYCIVQDPHFAHHDKHVTRGEIMSTHMADLLLRGRVTEKDIEDLFSYRLMKSARILIRQGSFRNAGRLDLLVEDRLGNLVVYELKKGVAGLAALEQVKRYMKAYANEHGVSAKRMRGVVLAQDAEPELLDALRKVPNVEFKKYWFSIEMK